MIKLKSQSDIEILKEGGKRLAFILNTIAKEIRPGVTTEDLDNMARQLISENGDRPAFLDYRPKGSPFAYPAALCVSLNDEIVHGIPSDKEIKEGDIVTIDLGLVHGGLFTDSAITVGVGKIGEDKQMLIDKTRQALNKAIEAVKPGNTTGDIGFAVENFLKDSGLGIVRDLAGHGVGYGVHEEPSILNFGKPGKGEVLEEGLVIAIEPMLTLGAEKTRLLDDGFTFITADGSMSAHFEHTVAVTKNGVKILTSLD